MIDHRTIAAHSRSPLPVGTIRMHRGVAQIKIAANVHRAQDRWRDYGRWLWEQHHGPVPEGKRVFRLDGDQTNHAITNLALGDPADNFFLWRDNHANAARRHYRRLRKIITPTINSQRAAIRRELTFCPTHWYAIDRAAQTIVNQPRRQRWKVMADAGLPATPANYRCLVPLALGFPTLTAAAASILAALLEAGPMHMHELRRKAYEVRRRLGECGVPLTPEATRSSMSNMPRGLVDRFRRPGNRFILYRATAIAAEIRGPVCPYGLVRGRELLAGDYRSWRKVSDYANPEGGNGG